MAGRDWYDWHAPYDDPSSGLSLRLSWVQERIRAALDEAAPGPVRLISMCAGQGHDVLGVLPGHPRRGDVTARLVELDPRNTEAARRLAAGSGLGDVEIMPGHVGVPRCGLSAGRWAPALARVAALDPGGELAPGPGAEA
jgi:hypothetical protein